MIIKKFQAKTEEDAMKLAKAELGDNVVILNVKKDVKPKGFLSFLKARLVEVTVAKEEESELQGRTPAEKNIKDTIASVDKLRVKEEQMAKDKDKKDKSEEKHEKKADEKSASVDEHVDVNKKLDSIQSMLEERFNKAAEESRAKAEAEKSENAGSQSAPAVKDDKDDEENQQIKDFLTLLLNTMVENEVDEKYAKQMISEVEQSFDQESPMEYILSYIYQKLILKFGKTQVIMPAEKKGPKVIYFIGPTGVGKTTTLAKLASKLQVINNKKIALFTADTYRIAATTQLETYARILNAPFKVIYTAEDMVKEFDNFRDCDYILIDTAGHSHQNEEQKAQMKELVHALDDKAEKEVYLVLAAPTKYRDLISIADAYKEMTDYRMIFTKLDETSAYGNILNLRIHTEAPLSYITCGQNVPDDIEKFSPQDIVRKLLGGGEIKNCENKEKDSKDVNKSEDKVEN